MSKISVIVPVYKVEKYLRRCIDSILAQTFEDFELIIVDDGSPDRCPEICDEYAQKDDRIKVIHKENGGLSSARNAGLDYVFENVGGGWVSFIDSDDWIHPETLKYLYGAVLEYDVKVAASNVHVVDAFAGFEDISDISFEKISSEQYYMGKSYSMIACAKFYHISCFENIRYPVGKLHEDEFTTYRIIYSEPYTAVTDMPLYFYYKNSDGIVKSEWTPKRMDAFEAFEGQIKFFGENGFDYSYGKAVETYAFLIHKTYVTIKNEYPKYSGYLKRVRKKMRHALKIGNDFTDISIESHPHFYETAYPMLMSLYQRIKALKNKLIK